METSLYGYVMAELEAWKGRWPTVADGSGVSLRTIEKIARREIKDPGVSHVEKIATFFSRHAARSTATADHVGT